MAFLAMAVGVHAALLLIPLKHWDREAPSADKRLTINLQTLPTLPTPAAAGPVMEDIPTDEPTEPIERKRTTASIVLEEIPLPLKLAEQPVEQAEELNAQRLRSLIQQSELLPVEAESRQQLGGAKQYQAPANWSRSAGAPYLAEFDNRFNGMTVPEKVEIVDRWLAADGSHNVVLNLPTGEALCGRAEAYNPTQPLIEPIMMFRPCGGGGKRTFSMPERYNKGQ